MVRAADEAEAAGSEQRVQRFRPLLEDEPANGPGLFAAGVWLRRALEACGVGPGLPARKLATESRSLGTAGRSVKSAKSRAKKYGLGSLDQIRTPQASRGRVIRQASQRRSLPEHSCLIGRLRQQPSSRQHADRKQGDKKEAHRLHNDVDTVSKAMQAPQCAVPCRVPAPVTQESVVYCQPFYQQCVRRLLHGYAFPHRARKTAQVPR